MIDKEIGKTQESHIITIDSLDSIISCMNKRGYILTDAEHFMKSHYLISMTYYGESMPSIETQQKIIDGLINKYLKVNE